MPDKATILLNQVMVNMRTFLGQHPDINPNNIELEQALQLLRTILDPNNDENIDEAEDETTQEGLFTPLPKLIYSIDEQLQHLLALMAANRLSPTELTELVKIMENNPSALKAVVKAQEKGMPGADAVLSHALQNLPDDKISHWKKQFPSLNTSSEYKPSSPFDIKPPRPDNS